MIKKGQIIESISCEYKVIDTIRTGRKTADIYLVKDTSGKTFILKHFSYSPPRFDIGRNKYNHYGRRRDGSKIVFNEIKSKCSKYDFLVKHIERILVNGKWSIIIEYHEGAVLGSFIERHYNSDINKCKSAIKALAVCLSKWHKSGFAHGDAHLFNALLQELPNNKMKVVLFDYSQIHHRDFICCVKYKCFSEDSQKRMQEDLANSMKIIGAGFLNDIKRIEQEHGLGTILSKAFENKYKPNSKHHTSSKIK